MIVELLLLPKLQVKGNKLYGLKEKKEFICLFYLTTGE